MHLCVAGKAAMEPCTEGGGCQTTAGEALVRRMSQKPWSSFLTYGQCGTAEDFCTQRPLSVPCCLPNAQRHLRGSNTSRMWESVGTFRFGCAFPDRNPNPEPNRAAASPAGFTPLSKSKFSPGQHRLAAGDCSGRARDSHREVSGWLELSKQPNAPAAHRCFLPRCSSPASEGSQ